MTAATVVIAGMTAEAVITAATVGIVAASVAVVTTGMIGEAAAVVSAATLALSGAITEATTAVGFAEAVRTTK